MIFKFLRHFLRDNEFERINGQLSEIKNLLEGIHQEQKRASQEERERVDPGFLALVWASIAVALAMGAEATTKFPKLRIGICLSLPQMVWAIIASAALLFSVVGLIIALQLTMDYAKSKSDFSYWVYAIALAIGILILDVGLVLLSFAWN